MKTHYYKGNGGNQAESLTEPDANSGKAWEIRTSKTGKGVKCEAVEVTDRGNGMIEMDIFGCKRIALASGEGMATEKKVKEVHERGLIEFARIMAEQASEPAPYVVGVGQILFSDGPFERHERAVYKVERPGTYKTVYLDGSRLKTDNHIREAGTRQGIGTYYRRDEVITLEEVDALVIHATESERIEKESEQAKRAVAGAEKARKIEEGSKIIERIPAGVTHVIVAEHQFCLCIFWP